MLVLQKSACPRASHPRVLLLGFRHGARSVVETIACAAVTCPPPLRVRMRTDFLRTRARLATVALRTACGRSRPLPFAGGHVFTDGIVHVGAATRHVRHPCEVLWGQLASYVAVKETFPNWTQPVHGRLAAQILKREILACRGEALVQHERGGAGDFALPTNAATLLLIPGLVPPTTLMHHVRDWPAEARLDSLAREDALETDGAPYLHTGLIRRRHCDVAGALGIARRPGNCQAQPPRAAFPCGRILAERGSPRFVLCPLALLERRAGRQRLGGSPRSTRSSSGNRWIGSPTSRRLAATVLSCQRRGRGIAV